MARRPRSSQHSHSHILVVVLLVSGAAACAAIAGLDYGICDGETFCDGTAVGDDASGATADGFVPRDDDAGSAAADVNAPPVDANLPDANPCKACPRGTTHQVCVTDGDGGCADSRRVFISSTPSTASLGGPNGADQRCQTLATTAGLNGQWRAWVSNSENSPSERFAKATVAYRLLDGTLVATSWADLTDGMLAHSIDLDERGVRIGSPVEVWTGTKVNGESGGLKCAGFMSALQTLEPARVGLSNHLDGGWTETYVQFCDRTDPRVYCFEQ